MIYNYENNNVSYEIIGEGIPVVIFHGLGCDSTMMKGCLEPVLTCKSGYKRIYIDLPGMRFF